MMAQMTEYVTTGVVYSDFLTAVIDNDLKQAVTSADAGNMQLLHIYVIWFYNRAPAMCWGSPEKRKAWQESLK
jgi:hypothetical protein